MAKHGTRKNKKHSKVYWGGVPDETKDSTTQEPGQLQIQEQIVTTPIVTFDSLIKELKTKVYELPNDDKKTIIQQKIDEIYSKIQTECKKPDTPQQTITGGRRRRRHSTKSKKARKTRKTRRHRKN
jgi:hypothetical protein